MRTNEFDYVLPPELIAQEPLQRRESSRLMVVDRKTESLTHDHFENIWRYLSPNDIVIANRSKVIPARLKARKATGGTIELLLSRAVSGRSWIALARPSRKLRPGMIVSVEGAPIKGLLERQTGDGEWLIRFEGEGDVPSQLRAAASLPLPPYIQYPHPPLGRYQTVYADTDGSIAAPTAGLHFSPALLRKISRRGTALAFVTLHVGPGTFKPVRAERIEDHRMQPEWGEVPQGVVQAVSDARDKGGRVFAVGTTTTRVLESAVRDGRIAAFNGETDMFIYPGYRFQAIDALVTNFHLPRSTLLMLVSSFAGRDLIMSAYQQGIEHGYRFYSFGDAMLIL